MKIHEVIQQVDLSKRAVKYYEEQGLLTVEKDANGYRNYTEQDVSILKEISFYRKLGISIQDIKALLYTEDKQLLKRIYQEKQQNLQTAQEELSALERFIQSHDAEAAYASLDYPTVAQALQDLFPGYFGHYMLQHFLPYLQISITTKEQQRAYENILHFLDNTRIKIPFLLRMLYFFLERFSSTPFDEQAAAAVHAGLQSCLHPTPKAYEALKQQIVKEVQRRNRIGFHPLAASWRKLMKSCQDQGYNDIFIPNMIALSPPYREYQEALQNLNQQLVQDLGLYYDSNYRIIMKKP